MKKYIKIILFCALLITSACRSQGNVTYWKTEGVENIAGKSVDGVSLDLNKMITEMNLHLSKDDDVLQISYPFAKEIKAADFKSITASRIITTGILLDSVYEVKQENNVLKIKFLYNMPGQAANRFTLNMVQITKKKYDLETDELIKERDTSISAIDILDLSALDLNVDKPEYFDGKNLAHAVNPIQLAQEMSGVDSIPKSFNQIFKIQSDLQAEVAYQLLAIENTRAFSRTVAEIGDIYFDNLELISNTKKTHPELILVSKITALNDIVELYDTLKTTLGNAKIAVRGLPQFKENKEVEEMAQFVSMSWFTPEKTVKLVIEVPSKFKRNRDDQMILPYRENDPIKIKETFEHYLGLYGDAKVSVFILTKEFDRLLKANPNLVGIPTTLTNYQRW